LTALELTTAESCVEDDTPESVGLDDAKLPEGAEDLMWPLIEVGGAPLDTTRVLLALGCRDIDIEVDSNALNVAEAGDPVVYTWFEGVVRVSGWNWTVRVALIASEALMTGAPPWALACSGHLWRISMIRVSNRKSMAVFSSVQFDRRYRREPFQLWSFFELE
jgi:hypothetical protein